MAVSSVKFTWSFSGGDGFGVGRVRLGLKGQSDANPISTEIVSITQQGTVTVSLAYSGRVSGSRSGDQSYGQVNFTLGNIRKEDENTYRCMIDPSVPLTQSLFDDVYLKVQGKLVNRLSSCTHI